MVFIHKQVYVDLENIFIGLMQWNKAVLSFEFANNYIDELLEQCYKVEKLSFHFSARYSSHKNLAQKFIATGGTVTPFGTSFTIWIMSKIFSSTKLSQTTHRINVTAK